MDIDVQGDERASSLTRRLASRLDTPRPRLAGLGDMLLEEHERPFAGGRLTLTGDLKRSLTERNDRNLVLRVVGDVLEFGSRLFYARFHRVVGVDRRQRKGLVDELRRQLLEDL